METVTCPRCGAANRADAMNCEACRINLRFALENPAEIARMIQGDAAKAWLHGEAWGTDAVRPSHSKDEPLLLPVLLLLGSFVFAFCLGEAVHELGHFLMHRVHGVNVGIKLDPFGGSMILNGSAAPREILGITSAAGPLLNLLVGMTVTLSLWHRRKPALLPLLLWGPIAFVQEGVTFSLGLLTPGGDAELIVESGSPAFIIFGAGVLFLAAGIAMICWVLPLADLSPADAFGRKFGVVAGGMAAFMGLRFLHASLFSPDLAQENIVPLFFSLLLATLVAALYGPVYSILSRISETKPVSITWPAVMMSTALGVGMILLQIGLVN
jgi:hypothetical protein